MDRRLIACAVLALAMAGCAPRAPVSSSDGAAHIGDGFVVRYVDTRAGVACWVFDGYKSGGIACLPCADVTPGVCGEATR